MALLLVTSITLEIAEPLIVARFIESIQLGLAEQTLITIALIFLGVAALRQITRVIAAYASERVSWTATNAVREDLSAHVLDLDLTFHESRSPGELIERIDGDVNQVAEFFSSLIVQLVGNALLVLGLIIAMTVVDWRIGLTFAAINVVGFFLLSKVTAKATAKWEDDREQSAQLIGYVSESIRATEDLRSSAATQHAMNRFHRRLRSWLPVKVRAEAWSSTIWIVMSLVFTASTAFAFGYGGFFYQNGEISLANTYLVVAFATMLNTPIEVLREQVQGLQQAKAAIRRISEMFGFSSKLVDGEKALPAGPLSVEFDHVGFEYTGTGEDGEVERKKVLDDLSFRLEPGTTLGLVGRTGAGKSTIAHLLFRMYDPVHGRVLLDGMDARSLSLSSLRSQCGFVTQDVHVFEATLRENLTFFDPAVPDERLLEILEALELRPWLDGLPDGLSSPISPKALSSGQAQLINLARVFLKDPGLVILDEPSSKLDLATEAMVERALDRLLAGRTVIIIAHRLDTIRRADQVLVLDRGTVLERGATLELLADPASHLAALHRVGEVTR
ncbi:ABC transporter ATP-binding protein [Lentzea sp. DG1S-22]|uniref:ABC transporter ATP-binding protein n=1 Tax=Lentzea sp. DG1S-22 TaxID=3108822 RepID=UPI002E778008|nr:ABC transporter ATP-binding protein [Lentzea sp. DG1S-22]WVH82071.1 ABC transporter ATP-binding protein [Lentzea sp. DG1S-22]